jgi:hypothetical protein
LDLQASTRKPEETPSEYKGLLVISRGVRREISIKPPMNIRSE